MKEILIEKNQGEGKTIQFSFKTTYETYKTDFKKSINLIPKDFFIADVIGLEIAGGKNATIQPIAEIADFIINSIGFDEEQKIDFSFATDDELKDSEFEVTLEV